MTIVETTHSETTTYQFGKIPGNASPKMELYNPSGEGHSPVDGFHYNDSTFTYKESTGLNGTKSHLATGLYGPDQCVAADSIWSIEPDTPVKLRIGKNPETDGIAAESVPSWFRRTVNKYPTLPALKVKRDGSWVTWTYQQYYDDVRLAAKAFIRLGLEPYHAVGIIGFNSPEWFISDIAAIYAGGLAVGIYTTNTAEASQYNAYDSRANIIVVDDEKQLQKILKVRHQLPHLRAIIQYLGEPPKGKYDDVYSWAEFMEMGRDVDDSVLAERQRNMAPNKCCTVIYTSGTTGNPKGAMLSHDNLIWTSKAAMRAAHLSESREQEVIVSYLPLSHVAAQMTDLYLSISSASLVYFAQPDALKGTLVDTLKEARPTALIGVPRVWEKMMEKMQSVSKKHGTAKSWVNALAQNVGLRGTLNQMNGEPVPYGWALAEAMVFRKVRQALGLDRCKFTCSGAAPMMRETQEFFLSYNIPIYDIYGMSESSGPHTFNLPGNFKIGSAGRELDGIRTKLDKQDGDGNGEICMYGRHIFMGYLGTAEKTIEVLDSQGYLHTGDIGRKDEDGFLFITGRLKELLITAGGENIPPVPIEDMVKEELPLISGAMLLGDKRKFLSILLTLKSDIDLSTGAPLDKLSRVSRDWIKDHCDVDVSTVSEALRLPSLEKAIEKGLINVNKKATSRAQCVQKFKFLPEDFSIPGGELGPTLKLKRNVVYKKYTDLIEQIYEGGDAA